MDGSMIPVTGVSRRLEKLVLAFIVRILSVLGLLLVSHGTLRYITRFMFHYPYPNYLILHAVSQVQS